MSKKSSVYTKMGDNGETGLVGGTRISKADDRIDLYGEVDELNSWLGIAITHMDSSVFKEEILYLEKIQCLLFDLGSNLACEAEKRKKFKLPNLTEQMISQLEEQIDVLDSKCPKLTNFILPGGSQSAANLHVCRTVCRKIERKMTLFKRLHQEELPIHAAPFMNRLSDFFFVLARAVNVKLGVEEKVWKPHT